MKNNKIIPYKKNIFIRISNFFKKLFFKNKDNVQDNFKDQSIYKEQEKEVFIENIILKQDEEKIRIQQLKEKYDNGEIDEEDLSESDIDKIISLYEKETDELNADTERRKEHISQMLKELKCS